MRQIVFFDFDKTLIAVNSGSLFIKRLWQERHLSSMQMLKAVAWLARYHMGFSNLDGKFAVALKTLKGLKAHDIEHQVQNFYHHEVRPHYRPGALKALEHHKKKGDRIVLLTSGPHPFAQVVSKDLQLDHCLCTVLEIDGDGHFTGNTVGPLCYGEGKLQIAKQFLSPDGHALKDCVFYTDSASDAPVMDSVGTPVAVNPDRVLRKMAKKNGWQIVDWGTNG